MSDFVIAVGDPEAVEMADGYDQVDEVAELDAPLAGVDVTADVTEDQVRALLPAIGKGLHMAAGLAGLAEPELPEQWEFTDDEIDGLAPPLTRVINRRPRLKAAAHRGDALVIAGELGGYFARNMFDGVAVRAAREEGATDGHQPREAGRARPRRTRPARRPDSGPAEPGRAVAGANRDEVEGLRPREV